MPETSEDIFSAVREAVGQSLQMAEAKSKIKPETQNLLGQLLLTRKGNGEIVVDVHALQDMESGGQQWTNKQRKEQDRYVNPTRLPQLLSGLSGLTPTQYLAFVQRPLERNGDNGPYLESNSQRLYDQYSPKECVKERNKLFGLFQRQMLELLLNAIIAEDENLSDGDQIKSVRESLSATEQVKRIATGLDISTIEVMERLLKLAIALSMVDRVKAKALQVKKSAAAFENTLKMLAKGNIGPTATGRVKEIFLGHKKDMTLIGQEFHKLNGCLQPIVGKVKGDVFAKTYSDLHRQAARLDAIASRWVIIMGEAANSDPSRSPVAKIQGMHSVFRN